MPRPPDEIVLTGSMREWDDVDGEEAFMDPSEADAYEQAGWSILEGKAFQDTSKVLAMRLLPLPDGDIQVQPRLDMLGRMNASGRHPNYGYSGYFKGYVVQGGLRRRLTDWWKLFPNDEHHYATLGEKRTALARIAKIVGDLGGTTARKTKGGYALFSR
jgi:hypothetical protein